LVTAIIDGIVGDCRGSNYGCALVILHLVCYWYCVIVLAEASAHVLTIALVVYLSLVITIAISVVLNVALVMAISLAVDLALIRMAFSLRSFNFNDYRNHSQSGYLMVKLTLLYTCHYPMWFINNAVFTLAT